MVNFLLSKFITNKNGNLTASERTKAGLSVSVTGILCNALLCTIKILAGLMAGSVSIMADGMNNLSDAVANIASLSGFKAAQKPADNEHPFGHARSEYISGFIVSVFIFLVGLELLKSSALKILTPAPVVFSMPQVYLLLFSMALKLWMSSFYKQAGEAIQSSTLIATAKDSLYDVYTTAAVLLGVIIERYTALPADGYLGTAVSLFILYAGYNTAKETLSPILGHAPSKETVRQIMQEVEKEPIIHGVHDLLVHDYGPGKRFASLHVEIPEKEDVLKTHTAIDRIERTLLEKHQIHMVIHHDPILIDDPLTTEIHTLITQTLKQIDEDLAVHDIHIEKDGEYTRILFDIEKPYESDIEDEQLTEDVTKSLKATNQSYVPVIRIDNVQG